MTTILKKRLKKGRNLLFRNHPSHSNAFLDEISSSGVGGRIPTHMTVAELTKLHQLAASLPSRSAVMEIGSYLGASSLAIASALEPSNGTLFCVDTWENETMPEGMHNTFEEFLGNTKKVQEQIKTIRKRSDLLEKSDFDECLNMVFIDGDHSYSAVKNDYTKTAPYIPVGGVLALHDCVYFAGVCKLIGEILITGDWQICGKTDNLMWFKKIGGFDQFLRSLDGAEQQH